MALFCFFSLSWLWICREKAGYFYVNVTNGHVQWDYPVAPNADDDDGDEMDISTTPPHTTPPEHIGEFRNRQKKKNPKKNVFMYFIFI